MELPIKSDVYMLCSHLLSIDLCKRPLVVANCLPWVPEKGTVGASGDLAPLSHQALGLMGEGPMWSPKTGWMDANLVSAQSTNAPHYRETYVFTAVTITCAMPGLCLVSLVCTDLLPILHSL